ncbi:MAG: CpaF family protein [Rhodospirillales bacterium]|nr:CpaF family protein [Rhodospirillales bacterium]
MLGRRKVSSSGQFVDLAEWVRQRALDSQAQAREEAHVPGPAANSGNRFAPQDKGKASPAEVSPMPRTKPAKVLSFNETPVYRIAERGAVKPEFLYQALALLEDRLSNVLDLDGSRERLAVAVGELIDEVLADLQARLSGPDKRALTAGLLEELAGLGPLVQLMADDSVSEIMVNGPDQVYVKRRDRKQLTDVVFRSESHLLRIARRIAMLSERRLDEKEPQASLRLPDGSRAFLIIPPLAVDGASITIRKGMPKALPLDQMVRQGNLSEGMATLLKVATLCRLNILISGGAASGKTTLLNAMAEMIDPEERLVAIEDIAELQFLQPHVVRLETRPRALSGRPGIAQLDLVKQALHMRPDRLILGDVVDYEAPDLLLTLSSGQAGMLATIHAKRPHAALRRLEDMVTYADGGVSLSSTRAQLAQSLDLIVHVEQMRDGLRRVTRITEVVGMEEDNILTQDLFTFDYRGEDFNGRVLGGFEPSGLAPQFLKRAEAHGLADALRKLR